MLVVNWVNHDLPKVDDQYDHFSSRLNSQNLYHHSLVVTIEEYKEGLFDSYYQQYQALSYSFSFHKNIYDKLDLDEADIMIVNNCKSWIKHRIQNCLSLEPDQILVNTFYNADQPDKPWSFQFLPMLENEPIWVVDEDHPVFELELSKLCFYYCWGKDPIYRYLMDVLLGRVTNPTLNWLKEEALIGNVKDLRIFNDCFCVYNGSGWSDLIEEFNDTYLDLKSKGYIGLNLSPGISETDLYGYIELAQMFDCVIWNNCQLKEGLFPLHPYLIIQSNHPEVDEFFLLSQSTKLVEELPLITFGASFDPRWGYYQRLYVARTAYRLLITLNPILGKYIGQIQITDSFITVHVSTWTEVELMRDVITKFNLRIGWRGVGDIKEGQFYRYWLDQKEMDSMLVQTPDGWVILFDNSTDITLPPLYLPKPSDKVVDYIPTANEEYSAWIEKGGPVIPEVLPLFEPDLPEIEFDITPKAIYVRYSIAKLCSSFESSSLQPILIKILESKSIESMGQAVIIANILSNWTTYKLITDWGLSFYNHNSIASYLTVVSL